MLKVVSTMVAALAFAPAPHFAMGQNSSASGSMVISSEPGKAMVVQTVEATAIVTGIVKETRTITLKGPRRSFDVVADDRVKNFDQIRVGQKVSVQYQRALSLELKKLRGAVGASGSEIMIRAKPGEQPAGLVGRSITVLADVVAVDPKKNIISLKGPRGNIVDLQVQNPDQFKVVKKGDQVEAIYAEALAVAVTPVDAGPSQTAK